MLRTLTLYPWNSGSLSYPAGAVSTQTLTAWGLEEEVSGEFSSQSADKLQLRVAAGANLTNSPFTYRSRVSLNLDGKTFFSGYVTDDVRRWSGSENRQTVTIQGPWWYLENLVFQQSVKILTAVNAQGVPTFTTSTFTHFTLNTAIQTNFTPGNLPGGGGCSITYTPVILNSQDQLATILDWAIQNGAWLQYTKASLVSIPVIPADVQDITCAEAIRRQLENVDAVAWIDHSTTPPTFHAQRRSALPTVTRKLVAAPALDATALNLKQRTDLAVPYVRIDFEQTNTVNGASGLNLVSDIYPAQANPPADQLKALITTVPLKGYSATITSCYLQTAPVSPTDLNWWLARRPEMDPNVNPNAATDYANLQLVGLPTRRTALPNMIVVGNYLNWMGGQAQADHVINQISYDRVPAQNIKPTHVASQTVRARIRATSLNFPNGVTLTNVTVNQSGENPKFFVGLAQIVYTDLNSPAWEGSFDVVETVYDAAIVLGQNYNVSGSLPAFAGMNALAQGISFTSRSGAIRYTVNVGPNRKLSPQQLADRLRASRLNYVTSMTPVPTQLAGGGQGNIELPEQGADDNGTDAHPQLSQQHIVDGNGGILLQGNAGSPVATLQTYDANGNAQTPKSTTPAGQVILAVSQCKGSDGKWHTLQIQELKYCQQQADGSYKQRSVLALCSDIYQGSTDPA